MKKGDRARLKEKELLRRIGMEGLEGKLVKVESCFLSSSWDNSEYNYEVNIYDDKRDFHWYVPGECLEKMTELEIEVERVIK